MLTLWQTQIKLFETAIIRLEELDEVAEGANAVADGGRDAYKTVLKMMKFEREPVKLIRALEANTRAISDKTPGQNDYYDGMRLAYVECLEILKLWNEARQNGLDYDIETKFPVA